ncbi:two-partner secretion domain-containing protein [Proteus vulgaris]|uniref:two-partner secretion domain-containing protein n=2 Tax=Proteus TaxID=583 RepID=UPI0034D76336
MMKKLNLFAKSRYGLLILCLSTNVYSSDNGIIVDTHKYKDLKVVKNQEGIETVLIEKTDENGSSFNSFTSFNVNHAGVIIDNRSAKANIIINEVTSQETSKLNGNLSVLGSTSALIIANPNGIECNQCQFSGVNHVSLVTGVNDINNKDHYNISDKEIIINGMGKTPKKQTINIVSNNIKIYGNNKINDLNILNGYNKTVFGDYLWDGLNQHYGIFTIKDRAVLTTDSFKLNGGEFFIDGRLRTVNINIKSSEAININKNAKLVIFNRSGNDKFNSVQAIESKDIKVRGQLSIINNNVIFNTDNMELNNDNKVTIKHASVLFNVKGKSFLVKDKKSLLININESKKKGENLFGRDDF